MPRGPSCQTCDVYQPGWPRKIAFSATAASLKAPYAELNGIRMPIATHEPSGLASRGSGRRSATWAGSAVNSTSWNSTFRYQAGSIG